VSPPNEKPTAQSPRKAIVFMILWFGLPLVALIVYQLLYSGRH
jgi:hypothetical protein